MFNVTLMKTEDWHVSIAFRGLGAVHVKDANGKTVKSTVNEKLYLMKMLDSLIAFEGRLNTNSEILKRIVSDFSFALNNRPSGVGFFATGAKYQMFFLTFPPEFQANRYIRPSQDIDQ